MTSRIKRTPTPTPGNDADTTRKPISSIYYRVTLEGDFKLLYTYTNPYHAKRTPPDTDGPEKAKKKKQKAPPPKKFWVKKLLGR